MPLSFRKSSNPTGQVSSPSAVANEDIDVKKLRAEFDRLLKIKDRLKRDYMLICQAKASDIEASLYKEMFSSYRERQVRLVGSIIPTIKSAGAVLTQLAIFSGLFLFVMEAGNREEAAHNESWQILNEVKEEEPSSAGRIDALQTLTKGCQARFSSRHPGERPVGELLSEMDTWPLIGGFVPDCASLRGLDVRKAHLAKIQLPGADLKSSQLQGTRLWKANLENAQLDFAALEGAKMSEVNLKDATLIDANLKGASLQNAELQKAMLWSAKLPEADLTDADLSQSILVKADLSSAKLSLEQLSGQQEPLLCQTKLPAGIQLDPNRDCHAVEKTLKTRYSSDDLEERVDWKKLVKELKEDLRQNG